MLYKTRFKIIILVMNSYVCISSLSLSVHSYLLMNKVVVPDA